jgi:predicted nucleotidyltransferase
MRIKDSPIAPIFRTENQGQILARIFLRPQRQWTSAALARDIGVAPSTLHAELTRLETAGLVEASAIGRARVLRPNTEHALARPLTEILEYIYGPRTVISEEFSGILGVTRLLIFGSWAARHAGEAGPVPHDIDVLVVGDADRAAVYTAADRAQERIGLPVNPVLASERRWDANADALIKQIKTAPTIDLTSELQPTEAPKEEL